MGDYASGGMAHSTPKRLTYRLMNLCYSHIPSVLADVSHLCHILQGHHGQPVSISQLRTDTLLAQTSLTEALGWAYDHHVIDFSPQGHVMLTPVGKAWCVHTPCGPTIAQLYDGLSLQHREVVFHSLSLLVDVFATVITELEKQIITYLGSEHGNKLCQFMIVSTLVAEHDDIDSGEVVDGLLGLIDVGVVTQEHTTQENSYRLTLFGYRLYGIVGEK